MSRSSNGVSDLKGRFVPEKYLAGLPVSLRRQRVAELTASREGQYGYELLPTDIEAQRRGLVRRSSYIVEAESRGIEHRGDFKDTAFRALRFYGVNPTKQNIQTVATELEKVFKKGLAAWQTGGHRPGATQGGWAYARVASVLVGGRAAHTADASNVARFPERMRRGILRGARSNPDLATYRRRVQSLVDSSPPSWKAAFQSHGLSSRPTVDEIVEVMLERTAGGADAGPRGRGQHTPPDAVRSAALHGLVLSHRFDYAGWDGIGLARAVQLATQPVIWDRAVDRMRAFFGRNKRYMSYSTFGDDDAGASSWMAWLNWGGTPGWKWASSIR